MATGTDPSQMPPQWWLGKYKIADPLPRRVRLKLWWHRRVNTVALALADRGFLRSAVTLWRACGMWD